MHILDPNFKYTNAAATDIRKTFERARQQLQINKVLKAGFPEFYFPIPETLDEQEYAESLRLMHQDMDQNCPWGN